MKLASRFKRVIALDNSEEMLEKARNTITDNRIDHVEFILGDTTVALNKNLHCDLMIFNMVLHHIPSPAEVFHDASKILNPEGVLLVADLCSHDQDWC